MFYALFRQTHTKRLRLSAGAWVVFLNILLRRALRRRFDTVVKLAFN